MHHDQNRPQLGPFALIGVEGQAGMGVVWRAVHTEQQVPVAIKFLTQEGSTDPLYQSCLRNEVRGVAALDHPAIVRVYDYGVVPDSLGVDSLAEGSPYLVMEFAEGGTLARRSAGLEWNQIYRVLMRLLDALAHAHARGVIHRDIKPDNVLLRSTSGGVILTDFGLARAGDTGDGVVLNAGTPSYMAPEQIRQETQEIGAWTDMYALGCLAWSLVCKRTPFQADTVVDLLDAHLTAPLPDLEPTMDVPPGLEGWIGRLLEKSPHHRFVRAADAAHALSLLQPEHENNEGSLEPVFTIDSLRDVGTVSPSGNVVGAVSSDDTQIMTITDRQADGGSERPAPMPVIEQPVLLFDRPDIPSMPDHWREEYTPRPSVHLLGTGVGLFGLRNLPVIGREKEQDRLWEMLKNTRSQNKTNAMVIRGADGAGKTHIATWLARRAHEVGAGIILRAQFQFSDSTDPLVDLIHNLLGTKGMQREEAHERIANTLDSLGRHDAEEVEALLTVLGPFKGEVYSDELMAERSSVRFTVIRRLLHRFSVLRPVVLLIDDAHRSVDAIDFVRTMVAPQTIERPVMLVMTANTILPTDSVRKPLMALMGMRRVDLMELGPLSPEHRSVLVRSMLNLEPTLASLVERRSGGNPQFAVQLMGDWVLKDAFVQGDGGFRLKSGVKPEFPADLQAVWERRLTAALPVERSTRTLELAADLGMDVDPTEWRNACAELTLEPAWDLVDALVEANLVRPKKKGRGWSFVHGLVREALKRQAEFSGNRMEHHRAIAAMLDKVKHGDVAVRRGRHLVGAGDFEPAIDVLIDGAEQCFNEGRAVLGMELLGLREQALREMRVPEMSIPWAKGWLLEVNRGPERQDYEYGLKLLEKIITVAENTDGNGDLAAKAWLSKGTIHRVKTQGDEARRCLERAMELAEPNALLISKIRRTQASLALAYGKNELANQRFEEALAAAEKTGDPGAVYRVRLDLGSLYRREGKPKLARHHIGAALKHYRKIGSKQFESRCLNDLAEIDRFGGDLERAEKGYLASLKLLEALGDQRFYIAGLNLGIIYAESGRTVEARTHLEQSRLAISMSGLPGLEGVTCLVLAHVHAQQQNFDAWRVCFSEGKRLIQETGFIDVDVARSARAGGEVLLSLERTKEARESLVLAREHWELLEWSDAAAEANDLINELDLD